MTKRGILWLVTGGLAVGLLVAAFATREHWQAWLQPPPSNLEAGHDHAHDHGTVQQVKLSPEAQSNLQLVSKPLKTETFWKTVSVPGSIVERPGHTDLGITAPANGKISKVFVVRGEHVEPEQKLFTLQLMGEVVTAQNELYKTESELQISQATRNRIAKAVEEGAVAGSRLIEIDNQLKRLKTAAEAARQELRVHGLTASQIEGVSQGTIVKEISVLVPAHSPGKSGSPEEQPAPQTAVKRTSLETPPAANHAESYEIQELNVEWGQQVQAGQPLCLLGQHEWLDIEGRAFRQEAGLIEQTARQEFPVEVEFLNDEPKDWPPLEQPFVVRSVAGTIDPASQTLPFYISLNNQSRTYQKNGQERVVWRFRPGQQVRLHLRVEKLEGAFVLPADALVHEGLESYVFQRNGDYFERLAVRVLHEDQRQVVLANEGNLMPGMYIAQNNAGSLNRALKSQGGSGHSGVHMHADGTIHQPGH